MWLRKNAAHASESAEIAVSIGEGGDGRGFEHEMSWEIYGSEGHVGVPATCGYRAPPIWGYKVPCIHPASL